MNQPKDSKDEQIDLDYIYEQNLLEFQRWLSSLEAKAKVSGTCLTVGILFTVLSIFVFSIKRRK